MMIKKWKIYNIYKCSLTTHTCAWGKTTIKAFVCRLQTIPLLANSPVLLIANHAQWW